MVSFVWWFWLLVLFICKPKLYMRFFWSLSYVLHCAFVFGTISYRFLVLAPTFKRLCCLSDRNARDIAENVAALLAHSPGSQASKTWSESPVTSCLTESRHVKMRGQLFTPWLGCKSLVSDKTSHCTKQPGTFWAWVVHYAKSSFWVWSCPPSGSGSASTLSTPCKRSS